MKLPDKKFGTVVVDPPWELRQWGHFGHRPNRRQELPYDTMTLEDIKSLPIGDVCDEGAHVYLWTTNKYLHEAFHIFESWNINFHIMLVWVKPSGVAPQGYVFGTEFCLLGWYGSPMKPFGRKGELNWFKYQNRAGEHSTKPDEFYHKVMRMSPEPRLDVFNRRTIPTFEHWGFEASDEFQPTLKEFTQ